MTLPATHHERPEAKAHVLAEHSRVRLLRAVPESGLEKGDKGTIVFVDEEGGYEVEFIAGRTRPAVVTLEPKDVEALREE